MTGICDFAASLPVGDIAGVYVFLPSMKTLVEAGLSYDEVKKVLKIPATWGTKIGGAKFRERISANLQARGGELHR